MPAIFKEIYDISSYLSAQPDDRVESKDFYDRMVTLRDPDKESARQTLLDEMISQGLTARDSWCTEFHLRSATLTNWRQFSDIESAQSWQDWHDQNFVDEPFPVQRSVTDNETLPYDSRWINDYH